MIILLFCLLVHVCAEFDYVTLCMWQEPTLVRVTGLDKGAGQAARIRIHIKFGGAMLLCRIL